MVKKNGKIHAVDLLYAIRAASKSMVFTSWFLVSNAAVPFTFFFILSFPSKARTGFLKSR